MEPEEVIAHILWLGPVFDERTLLTDRPISTAANRWQTGLIGALQESGVAVTVIAHLPERLWPRGSSIVRAEGGTFRGGLRGTLVSYWNMPSVRRLSLGVAYLLHTRSICGTRPAPDLVLSYNVTPWHAAAGIYAQRACGVPWVSIIADAPTRGMARRVHDQLSGRAAGRAYLSWGGYLQSARPALHLDGGIVRTYFDANNLTPSRKKIVVYTGTVVDYAGTDFLVDSFRSMAGQDVELWICGRGKDPELRHARRDPRIRFFGLVSQEEVDRICRAATVFVNPRPTWFEGHLMDFPSKVLEYLAYGKPVVSTWTAGLSPEYADVLVVLKEETQECLAATLRQVLDWTPRQLDSLRRRIGAFIEPGRRWTAQAKRLLDWVDREVRSTSARGI